MLEPGLNESFFSLPVLPALNQNRTKAPAADSPPVKRQRIEPSNFGSHEARDSYPSPAWKSSTTPPPVQCRSSSLSTHDDVPNQHGRTSNKSNEPRNLIITPDITSKEFSTRRESSSPIEIRASIRDKSVCSNSESVQDDFESPRFRHDEHSFFAGK